MVGPFLAFILEFGSFLDFFWTRFGLLAKSRSGNPDRKWQTEEVHLHKTDKTPNRTRAK